MSLAGASTSKKAAQNKMIEEAPPEEVTPEQCLDLNLKSQKEIQATLSDMQYLLECNRKEQESILAEREYKKPTVHKTNYKRINLFAYPYFRSVRGMVAPENEDAIAKRNRNDVDAYILPPRPWTRREETKLYNAVLDNVLKIELKPLCNRESFLVEKLKKVHMTEEEEDSIKQEIEEVRMKMKLLKKKPKLQLIEELKEGPDWLTISSINMKGTRSAESCEAMWRHYLHPRVNRGKFTPEEDFKLKKIVEKHHRKNWDAIAKELKTNRTPIQCLERYQNHLNSDALKGFWTPEDDLHLQAVINACRIGDFIPWYRVTNYMGGRSYGQVYARWNRHLKPESRIDKWTPGEDAMLYAAFRKYGKHWKSVAEYLPLRNNYACRERILHRFLQTRGPGGWTIEEDRIIIKCYADFGEGKWPKVASRMLNRTSKGVALRFRNMKKKNDKMLSKAIEDCKSGLPEEAFLPEQILPTKDFPSYTSRRNKAETAAMELLNSALLKINGTTITNDPQSFKNLSVKTLKQLSAELLTSQESDRKLRQPRYRPLRVQLERREVKEERLRRMLHISSSSSSEESEEQVEVTKEDEERLNDELEEVFLPRCAAGIQPLKKYFIAKSYKDVVERNTLKYLIFKAFGVDEKPETPTLCRGVDFEDSIGNLLKLFIYPPMNEGYLPVIPPSQATLSGQLIMFVMRSLLDNIAVDIDSTEAIEYFKTIVSEDPNISVQCLDCQQSSQSKLEGPCKENDVATNCKCALLHSMRSRYSLIKERFVSTFLWPSLLSTVPLSKRQIDKVIRNEGVGIINLKEEQVVNENGTKRSGKLPFKRLKIE